VVHNSRARTREVVTAGAVAVRVRRVDDRRVDPVTGRVRRHAGWLPEWVLR